MTIGLAMIVSGMMANPLTATNQTTPSNPQTVSVVATDTLATTTAPANTSKLKNSPLIKTNTGIENEVRAYFADVPIMAEVARCESHYHQYESDGTIFRGIVNNKDVGVMQINEHYHLDRAQKLGIDIYTVEGNLEYARVLYKEQGVAPWISSSPCWGKTTAAKNDPDASLVAENY